MYLNDFRVEKILEVVNDIKATDNTDLLYKIGIDENDKGKFAFLHYVPYLHRLDAFIFEPTQEALYPNPEAVAILMPKKKFLQNIKPDDTFEALLNA